jgi:hypothetical protein
MLGVLVTRVVFLLMEATPILMVMGSKVRSDEISCFHQISQGDWVYNKNIVCIYVCCSSLPHSLLSPTHIHGYEKANEHVPFCVQVMYLKIVEQPTFSKPLYLTSFP